MRIRQAINDKGQIIGIGWFETKTKEELKINRKKIYHKQKLISLMAGSIPEGNWQVLQTLNYKGKLIGIGYFQIRVRGEYRDTILAYNRKHYLHIRDGDRTIAITGLNKRDYPERCEICNKNRKRLVYHHWDDSNYNKGIWCCGRCHQIIECMDRMITDNFTDFMKVYLIKKSQIEEEFKKIK